MFTFLTGRRLAPLFLAAGLMLGGCGAASLLPPSLDGVTPPAAPLADASPAREGMNAQVYDLAVAQVERLYYDPSLVGETWTTQVAARRASAIAAPDERSFYNALDDLMETLDDRHTNVVGPTPRALREVRQRGEASVVYGVTLVRREGGYFVEEVRPGSPAEEAGIEVGWRLLRVNDMEAGQPMIAVEDRADAFVFIDGEGAERIVSLSGRRLEGRPPTEVTRRDDGVVVLRFNQFDIPARDWLREQLATLDPRTTRGVVIDLRLNGGGRLAVLGEVVGMFQGRRQPYAVMTGRLIDRRLVSGREAHVWTGPTAILIGPGSGSASELLAAAFQESGRGPVVGRRSAGAVIASRSFNLPDGGELSVSVNAILTARRVLLEKAGVTPDIVVEPTPDDLRARRDVTLERAVDALGLDTPLADAA